MFYGKQKSKKKEYMVIRTKEYGSNIITKLIKI